MALTSHSTTGDVLEHHFSHPSVGNPSRSSVTAKEAVAIARQFAVPDFQWNASPVSGGHINDSWHIWLDSDQQTDSFLLQRINDHVFVRPALVMENVERVISTLLKAFEAEGIDETDRLTLSIVRTRRHDVMLTDGEGACWRMFRFIDQTVSLQQPENTSIAYKAAQAFGAFQRRLASYDGPRMHETIPRFHDTPSRLGAFEKAIATAPALKQKAATDEIRTILSQRNLSTVLLKPFDEGAIPERIVHNDAKLSNVLFDANTEKALCVVDLDTVMPGLSLYDFGDMVRSMACFADEDETDLGKVVVQTELVRAIAAGYLEEMADLLTDTEHTLLLKAALLITYEQAVRFLTDYLDGDRYYSISRPNQNLDRCRVQLTILNELAALERDLGDLIAL